MITKFYSAGLYISSFFPLYVLLILNNYESFTTWKNIKSIIYFDNLAESVFWYVILLLMILSIINLLSVLLRSQNLLETFGVVNSTEDNLLSYVVTYLVPLLSIEVSQTNSLLVNAGLFLLLGFIYVRNNLIYLNPLFLFFGYNIFRNKSGVIVISNYKIHEINRNKEVSIRCRKLGYKLFIVKKSN